MFTETGVSRLQAVLKSHSAPMSLRPVRKSFVRRRGCLPSMTGTDADTRELTLGWTPIGRAEARTSFLPRYIDILHQKPALSWPVSWTLTVTGNPSRNVYA